VPGQGLVHEAVQPAEGGRSMPSHIPCSRKIDDFRGSRF
jgi:hypothetical protein